MPANGSDPLAFFEDRAEKCVSEKARLVAAKEGWYLVFTGFFSGFPLF